MRVGQPGHYFNMRKTSIYGGSNEIQRNIIAKGRVSGALEETIMDFSFTEEQTLLRNSVSKYLADNYDFETWRKFTRTDAGCEPERTGSSSPSSACWPRRLPEAYGGLGGGAGRDA